MNKERFSVESWDFSYQSVIRGFLLFFIPFISYVLGLFPLLMFFGYMVNIIPFYGIFFYFCVAILIVVCFLFFLFLEAFIPGIIIRIFHIQVKEGEYDLSIKDKGFFTHLLFFMLYRPSLHLIGIIPLVPLRLRFLKLVGLTIGKHSMIAGTELIDEPYAVTIGDHTFIGGYTIIYTHLSFKKMINKPVCIGNNCFIGNKSVILPGVVIEDDVVVKPGSVVPSDQVLKQGGVYAGNPAKKISS